MDEKFFDSPEFDEYLDNFFSNDDDTTSESNNDDNVSTCSSSQTPSGQVHFVLAGEDNLLRQKVKRIRNNGYIPSLRVLRRDVRRSYAEMYVNVWNSTDLSMLYGFLDTYFVSDFKQESVIDPNSNRKIDPTVAISAIQGTVSVVKFWYTMMLLFPNVAITLKDTQVVNSDDPTLNRVIARVRIKGTRVCSAPENFNIKNVPTTQEETELYKVTQERCGKRSLNNSEKRLPIVESLLQSTQATVDSFPLADTPFEMDIEASMVLFTDEHNRVTKFLMINHSGTMGGKHVVGGGKDCKTNSGFVRS